jgi:glycosyltransferase involved in cell wall biosynthesis
MRVLILTPYLYGTAPGPRSSIELWERVLAPAGITFDYAPFEDERLHAVIYARGRVAEKARLMTRAYALIGPELFERWVARAGVPIIYQLDDPLYVPYRSPANGYLSYLKFFGKVGRIARISAMTIVNSPQHYEYVSRYTSRIRSIPILVDADEYCYEPRPRAAGEPVRVGWTGSPTTAPNLELIAPSLRRLGTREDVELVMIGGGDYRLPGVRMTVVPWRAATEVQELRRLDVGLLPVPVTEWNKRKFFMKLIQYMSLAIPPVCTPIGATPQVVTNGENGLLADGEGAWTAALTRLVDDGVLRASMGEAAARTAHAGYTVQARAADIVEAFTSAVTGRG